MVSTYIPNNRVVIPLLAKYNLDINNKDLQELLHYFGDSPSYLPWAIKNYFGENSIRMGVFEEICYFKNKNPELISKLKKRNIISYKQEEINSLIAEMSFLTKQKKIKQAISKFNTTQREILNNIINNFTYEDVYSQLFLSIVSIFNMFDKIEIEHQKNLIKKVSDCNDYDSICGTLYTSLKYFYLWNKDSVIDILNNKFNGENKIVYNKDNILIAEILTFSCIQTMAARTAWCIQKTASSFKSYTTDKIPQHHQYMMWNFNYPETHDLSLIGFTYDPENGLNAAHTMNNTKIISSYDTSQLTINDWDNKYISIADIFAKYGISAKLFLTIDKPDFNWSVNGFINKIRIVESNILYNKNNKILCKCTSSAGLKTVFSNIKNKWVTNRFDSKKNIFVLIDFDQEYNDDNSIIIFTTDFEPYGDEYISNVFNVYHELNKEIVYKMLSNLNIDFNLFLTFNDKNLSLKFHKAISVNCTDEATKLFENHKNEINLNYEYNNTYPIFLAIKNKNIDNFKLIVSNSDDKINYLRDETGVGVIQNLVYSIRGDNRDAFATNALRYLTNNNIIDWNVCDINNDTSLNLASDCKDLVWFVEFLLKQPNIEIDIVNDNGITALDRAYNAHCDDVLRMLQNHKNHKNNNNKR